MSKFVSKPVYVDAYRWDGGELVDVPDWLKKADEALPFSRNSVTAWPTLKYMDVYLTSGIAARAEPGNYVVRLGSGDLRVMKAQMFEAVFEPEGARHVLSP